MRWQATVLCQSSSPSGGSSRRPGSSMRFPQSRGAKQDADAVQHSAMIPAQAPNAGQGPRRFTSIQNRNAAIASETARLRKEATMGGEWAVDSANAWKNTLCRTKGRGLGVSFARCHVAAEGIAMPVCPAFNAAVMNHAWRGHRADNRICRPRAIAFPRRPAYTKRLPVRGSRRQGRRQEPWLRTLLIQPHHHVPNPCRPHLGVLVLLRGRGATTSHRERFPGHDPMACVGTRCLEALTKR